MSQCCMMVLPVEKLQNIRLVKEENELSSGFMILHQNNTYLVSLLYIHGEYV